MNDINFLDLCRVVADHLPASDLEREFRMRIAERQEELDEVDTMAGGMIRKIEGVL